MNIYQNNTFTNLDTDNNTNKISFFLSKGGKTKKRKLKIKKNKTIKKKLHYIPTKNKTVWSSGMFGERQVINYPKYISRSRADNLNKIKGKNKHLLRDEYKRRLKVLLKKSKKSRKHFQKKTKKKYNKKSIDTVINNISDEKLLTLYKNILKKN